MLPGLIKENAHEMIERLEVIAWATNPKNDTFLSLKQQISKYAMPLFHANNILFSMNTEAVSNEQVIPGEIRQNCFLIAKEAFNNCIKYAEASSCSITFKQQQGFFQMNIRDNGKGMDGTVYGTGQGFKNMKRRTGEMRGTFNCNSTSSGTEIELLIPVPFRIPKTWD